MQTLGPRQETRIIAGHTWTLSTVDAFTAERIFVEVVQNTAGLFDALARGEGGTDPVLSGVGGALRSLKPAELIEAAKALLAGVVLQEPGKAPRPVTIDELGGLLSGNLPAFNQMVWWALQLNYPFAVGASAPLWNVAAKLAALVSAAMAPSPGGSSDPSTPASSPSPTSATEPATAGPTSTS
jgi:hypothetical protein